MIKNRWFSLALAILLCFAPALGAAAEGISVDGAVDDEVMPAEWAGDTGLTVEAELPAPTDADETPREQETAWEGGEEAEAEASDYWRAAGELFVYVDNDAEAPFASLAAGGVVLMLDSTGKRARVAFNSDRGAIEGSVEPGSLVRLSVLEADGFLDEAAASGALALYQGDLDRPLPLPECMFIDPADPAENQASERGDGIPGTAETVREASETAISAPEAAKATDEIENDVMAQEYVAATDFSLSATKLSVGIKEKYAHLTANLVPEGSVGAVTWRSASTKIAKVDASTGVITGVKAGTTTIYAKLNGIEKSCKVTVKAAPKQVTLSPTKATLSVGQTLQLSATLTSNTASALACASSREDVATVDAHGLVTALKKGTATITVKTFNGKKAKCKVTVLREPEQVLLPDTFTLSQGERKAVTASALDGKGKASVAVYTYSAENGTGEISIDPNTGEVLGVAPGTATIRVTTHNGVSTHLEGDEQVLTECAVTVEEGPTEVGFVSDKVVIGLRQSFALRPVLLSSKGEEMEGAFTVQSSNSKKLSVNAKGVVKGLGKGTYTVTVKAYNGATGKCAVKVVSAPSKVTLKPSKPVIGVGQTEKLTAVFPKDTMASCTFSSSNNSVAVVDAEGCVTGVKVGTAVIKVKTHNSKTAKVTVTVTRSPDFIALNGDYTLEFDPVTHKYSTVYTATLDPHDTFQISYENEYRTNGGIAAYESDDTEVATVSKNGRVTAKAAGTANITVRSTGGAEAVLRVNVTGKLPAQIAFDAPEASLAAGQTLAAPGLLGKNTDAKSLAKASYATGDSDVFTVAWSDEEACWLLTGVSPGEATLTATAAGATAKLPVKVAASGSPAELRFADSLVYMSVGDSFAPSVTDEYDNAVAATLTSDAPSVVAVDDSGNLSALAEGDAVITAAYGGLRVEMRVSVRASAPTVSLSRDQMTLGVGQKGTLKAQVNGDGSAAGLSFCSSDTSVATVSRTGRVIARGVGEATVTASVDGASASCEVRVGPAPTAISLEPAAVNGRLGEGGAQLKWSFGAPDEVGSVFFTVDDASVAAVDGKGYVTFKAKGTTRLTAATDNGMTATIPVTVLPKKAVSNSPTYRLFAAYGYFDSDYRGYIPFTRNNAKSLVSTFGKSSIGGIAYSAKVVGNPSKTQLLSGIAGFFANAGEDDVSVVYLCSHGHMNSDYTGYRMSLPGYDDSPENANYFMTSQEIMNCLRRIDGSVVLILDSCYSGTFLEDMRGQLDDENGRIAVITAASDTRATYYNVKDTSKAVDFFTFFLLKGLGYNAQSGWWNADSKGGKGRYPGYLAADAAGNGDGVVTLDELFDFTSKSIAANIPNYMKKSWYWGDKTRVQVPRYYAGDLGDLVIYQPK